MKVLNKITIFMVIGVLFGCSSENKILKKIGNKNQGIENIKPEAFTVLKNETDLIDITLKEDTTIHSSVVVFKRGSRIYLNEYNLQVYATKVIFEDDVFIYGFKERTYAKCRTDGKNSGDLTINADEVEGDVRLLLLGEYAGLMTGMYSEKQAIGIVYQSDWLPNLLNDWVHSPTCKIKESKKVPIKTLTPKKGGDGGTTLIVASDVSNFIPYVFDDQASGSYRSYYIKDKNDDFGDESRIIRRGKEGSKQILCINPSKYSPCIRSGENL